MSAAAAEVSQHGRLSHSESVEVGELIAAVADVDGVSPVNEHVLLHLRHGGDAESSNFLLRSPEHALAGYAHLDPTDPIAGPAAELAVHPDHRAKGWGRVLLSAVEAASPDGRLRLWAHGAHAGAEALAVHAGYRRTRVLWQMRKSLLAQLPAVEIPDGVRFRPFVAGQDEAAWTELNNAAFAGHPDQSGWSEADIQLREKEPWFDPEGFLLAERIADHSGSDTGSDGGPGSGFDSGPEPELIGFHWTKIHGSIPDGDGPEPTSGAADSHAHEPIGEVYVLGVHPSARGMRLGPALTIAGLRYLRGRGLRQVMLYVDESNTAAISVYTGLGFTRWDTDISYLRNGDQTEG